jgi:hypothetical protein
MTDRQKETFRQVLAKYGPTEFHHGDCLGADAVAHAIVRSWRPTARIIIHPPSSDSLRAFCQGDAHLAPKPYLARNQDIVDECEVLVAAPKDDRGAVTQRDQGYHSLCKKEGRFVGCLGALTPRHDDIPPGVKQSRSILSANSTGPYRE